MNNLLPKDGTVHYYGKIFTEEQSEIYYVKLLNEINWQHDVVKIFGKEIITKRKVAFLGDEGISYKYSGKTKIAEKFLNSTNVNWLKFILEIKSTVEQISGEKFNACLLNYYHNGSEAMSWHSISFGAERKFGFKHNFTKEEISLMLENGSLLIMKDETQIYWKHKLYTNAKITEPRINLTFRTIVND